MTIIIDNIRFLLVGQFPEGPLGGLSLTILLTVVIGVLASAVGVTLASLMMARVKAVSYVSQGFSVVVRSLPSLVFLFWMYYLLPQILGIQLTPFESATIALTLYHGAFIAEDIRGGLNAVSSGQWEAAATNGLNTAQAFRMIILPQAVRIIIPTLVNRYMNLFLYTSVVSVVGVMDFTRASVLLSNRTLLYPIEIFGFAAGVYFALCYCIASAGKYFERRYSWTRKASHNLKTV